MIAAACPRCVVYGRAGTKWHATGRFITRVTIGRAFIAAELACDTLPCHGRMWTTGCRDAVEAGQRVRAERGEPPYELGGIDPRTEAASTSSPAPQPSLPHSRVRQDDFTGAGALAADWKQRQGGDTE